MIYSDANIIDQLKRGVPLSDILNALTTEDIFKLLIQYPQTLSILVAHDANQLRRRLRCIKPEKKPYGNSYSPLDSLVDALAKATPECLRPLRPEIAEYLVTHTHKDLDPRSDDLLTQLLPNKVLPQQNAAVIQMQVALWSALKRLKAAHSLERQGLERLILKMVEDSPVLWAESLHLILQDSGVDRDFAIAITVSLAAKSDEVRESLVELSDSAEDLGVREQARELIALAECADKPRDELVHRLLNVISCWANAGVIFPHPLSLSSKTWLTSHDAEADLRGSFRQGLDHFRSDFLEQGGKNERALVQSLLSALAAQFRTRRPVARALSRLGIRSKPSILLEHRTLIDSEEKIHGPDIAFLVHGRIYGAMHLETAEFVQVKKPKQSRKAWIDAWTINVEQLKSLLNTSQSSVYWLIDKNGIVLTVPAKYIRAHMPAVVGETFTFRFNDARSVAVPADEFFNELLLGAWLGNTFPVALEIARGNVPGLVPANLVEVQVRLGHDDQ